MHHYGAKNFWLVVAAGPLLALLSASLASASPVDVTLVSPDSLPITVTEGNSVTLIFKYTNNETEAASPFATSGGASYVSGDVTDTLTLSGVYNFFPPGYAGCGATPLAAGASCFVSGLFVTPPDVGEADGDSALWDVLLRNGWSFPSDLGINEVIDIHEDVTVQDPVAFGPTGVPEPMSLAMLGAGLLGLAGLRRRRKAT